MDLRKVERFHSNKESIPGIVLSTLDDGEVIYGERAVEARLPDRLHRNTTDYDVYSKNPRKDALEAERELDKAFGGDYFETVQAQHPGTWKVRSKINGEGYADFTDPKKRLESDDIYGRKYIKLQAIKKRIREILKDKTQDYRHNKDKDTLNRIRVFEQIKRDIAIPKIDKSRYKLFLKTKLDLQRKEKISKLTKPNSSFFNKPKGKRLKWL